MRLIQAGDGFRMMRPKLPSKKRPQAGEASLSRTRTLVPTLWHPDIRPRSKLYCTVAISRLGAEYLMLAWALLLPTVGS
jgi:hypothetical protein